MFSWRVVGASCRGSAHIASSRPNDDRFAGAVLGDRFVLAIVADGAGSAENGGLGAQFAVQSASEFFAQVDSNRLANSADWSALLLESLEVARRRIAAEAEAARALLTSFATTLQVVLASECDLGYLQIGDGAAVAIVSDGLLLLTPRSENEYVNETHFVTSSQYREHTHVSVLSGVTVGGLAVFSDGLTSLSLKIAAWSAHDGFFTPLFHFLRTCGGVDEAIPAVESLLDSHEAHQRSDDDRTLVVALPIR